MIVSTVLWLKLRGEMAIMPTMGYLYSRSVTSLTHIVAHTSDGEYRERSLLRLNMVDLTWMAGGK